MTESAASKAARIDRLPCEDRERELLKWALARITFYGPTDDPCAVAIREHLDGPKQEAK